jgi:hypothetical protein
MERHKHGTESTYKYVQRHTITSILGASCEGDSGTTLMVGTNLELQVEQWAGPLLPFYVGIACAVGAS